MDCGSKLLLIDEDKSATNFMIRDAVMKELIEKEPITPFTERVNGLLREMSVSTILVIGGSGEYLRVAHKVYLMDEFLIHDATKRAKEISERRGGDTPSPAPAIWAQNRTLLSDGFTPYPEGSGSERLLVSDMGYIIIGDERIDIRMLQNIASQAQLNAICFMLRELEITCTGREIDLEKSLSLLYYKIETEGLDCVYSSFFTACDRFMDLPRRAELTAVINRMRGVKFKRG